MVSDLIARMDRWLAANRLGFYAQLQAGVLEPALHDFQKRFGIELPESFRLLYAWRNGQSSDCFESFQQNQMFLSLENVAHSKEILDGMIGYDFEDPRWWRIGWIPFLANGGGDYLCLDLDVEAGAKAGRLIAFWHDWEDRSVKYASIDDWLCVLVQSMEGGTLELS
jgi:cell wall assembly regulator SMI1